MDVAVSNIRTFIYNRGHSFGSLWKIPITAGKGGDPIQVTETTARDKYAQFSPDGKRIVFESGRSGVDEIWLCDADGQNAIQLTAFGGGISGSPRWSPDGRMIAFDSNVGGSFDVYVVPSGGGKPLRLTTHVSTDAVPTWSRDGAWVYFTSWRTGRAEVWKVRSNGGSETQITTDGGSLAAESADARYLYFVRGTDLFRMQADSGHLSKVVGSVTGRFLNVFPKGIYFASGERKPELRYLDFASGVVSVVARLPGLPDIVVSADQRWILYPQPKLSDTNLMVVETSAEGR
jgi:Tol biopolymer transport system component